jgi:uncharacterized protein (DUF2252 family)
MDGARRYGERVPTDPLPTPPRTADRRAFGRDVRRRVARRDLARLTTSGRDPLAMLTAQNAGRLPDLVPLRAERMAASPFAFFRGAAAVMAADLARDAAAHGTGIMVAACGDAHVANFGFYASPQRTLVFDLNDFDEAGWAPWEWDLKRLVTSIVLAGGENARDEAVVRDAAASAVRTYAHAIDRLADRDPVTRYFEHFDPQTLLAAFDDQSRAVLAEAMRDAEKRTGERAARRLTTDVGDGRRAFVERPPTMTHVDDRTGHRMLATDGAYRASANVDVRLLLEQYEIADVARRVVGVGSVGTRCYLVLLQDGDGHSLVMQAKEAGRSVLEEYGGIASPAPLARIVESSGEGARVVSVQRVLQAVSDPFLGHVRSNGRDYYVRQFHDMKGGIEMVDLDDAPFRRYAQACAATLARAHAQSPNAAAVAGYAGAGRALAEAITTWAFAYAEVTRDDHAAFVAARS